MITSQSPEVSICIPTYNQTKHLLKTLDSILNQSFKDFEIIVSDDSTNEDVYFLIESYKSKFNSVVQYFRNIPSLGSPNNWNFILSKAKGKWIKIIHHDDWFCKEDALEKFVKFARQKPNALIFSGIQGDLIGEKRRYVNLPNQDQINFLKKDPFSLIWANVIGPPSTIIFPNVQVAFDSRLIWLVDIEFYLQLLINLQFDLICIDEVLIENHPDEHNITNHCFQNKQLELKEFNFIFNKYLPGATFKKRLEFLHRLKLHISSYTTVNFIELLYSSFKYK